MEPVWLTNQEYLNSQGIKSQSFIGFLRASTESGSLQAPVVVKCRRQENFMAAILAARQMRRSIILANPDWPTDFHRALINSIGLCSVCDDRGCMTIQGTSKISESVFTPRTIAIPTGGTSGRLKLVLHSWNSLESAVCGYLDFMAGFEGSRQSQDALIMLPLYHVSGLMAALRALFTGGTPCFYDYRQLKKGRLPAIEVDTFALSLVPTQLKTLLHDEFLRNWLPKFKVIFLGGAMIPEGLLAHASSLRLNLAPCYGMTETAAMVTAVNPEEFLKRGGSCGSGQPMPHATVSIDETGRIVIESQALYQATIHIKTNGTAPDIHPRIKARFTTADRGYFNPEGDLIVTGRCDRMIISGGENVDPQRVETVLTHSGMVGDVAVIGVPDEHWGERVIAIVKLLDPMSGMGDLRDFGRRFLDAHERPKQYYFVKEIPRNEAGKINRENLVRRFSSPSDSRPHSSPSRP